MLINTKKINRTSSQWTMGACAALYEEIWCALLTPSCIFVELYPKPVTTSPKLAPQTCRNFIQKRRCAPSAPLCIAARTSRRSLSKPLVYPKSFTTYPGNSRKLTRDCSLPGLADPAPIVFTFNSNSLIQDNFRIDSVVCLVDAKHVAIHLDDVKVTATLALSSYWCSFSISNV